MNNFRNIKSSSHSFSTCDGCASECCDGSKNILFAQILLSDFDQVSKYFPILFTIGTQGYARPVTLLTNGKDFCKYINNFKCTIYVTRPSVCRVYPLSPHIDNEIYIDNSCPAVSSKGGKNIDNTNILTEFDHDILKDYKEKYSETVFHFNDYNQAEHLDLVTTINEIKFYKFNKDFDDNYLKLHQKSLLLLKDEYFKLF